MGLISYQEQTNKPSTTSPKHAWQLGRLRGALPTQILFRMPAGWVGVSWEVCTRQLICSPGDAMNMGR